MNAITEDEWVDVFASALRDVFKMKGFAPSFKKLRHDAMMAMKMGIKDDPRFADRAHTQFADAYALASKSKEKRVKELEEVISFINEIREVPNPKREVYFSKEEREAYKKRMLAQRRPMPENSNEGSSPFLRAFDHFKGKKHYK